MTFMMFYESHGVIKKSPGLYVYRLVKLSIKKYFLIVAFDQASEFISALSPPVKSVRGTLTYMTVVRVVRTESSAKPAQ